MTRVSLSIQTLAFADMARAVVDVEVRRAAAMAEDAARWHDAIELMGMCVDGALDRAKIQRLALWEKFIRILAHD
jgi:hypothetical protein